VIETSRRSKIDFRDKQAVAAVLEAGGHIWAWSSRARAWVQVPDEQARAGHWPVNRDLPRRERHFGQALR